MPEVVAYRHRLPLAPSACDSRGDSGDPTPHLFALRTRCGTAAVVRRLQRCLGHFSVITVHPWRATILLSPSKHPYVQGWLHEGRTSTGSFVLSWRSVMNRGPVWLSAMIIGIVAGYLSVSAAAQSPASKGQHCPAGYSLVASVCVNSDGDVVEPR